MATCVATIARRHLGAKISPIGELLWQAEGKLLDHATNSTTLFSVVAFDYENLYFTWTANTDVYWPQVYMSHLNAAGETAEDPFWLVEQGAVLCDAARANGRAKAVATDDRGIVAVWSDYRSHDLFSGSVYAQRVFDPNFASADEHPILPTEFSLSQNYPNPFNPETVIEFALPAANKATLKVFDVTGRLVATLIDESLAAGVHRTNFDAARLASGVYFYRLEAAKYSMTRKMVVLK
ncbi:MAG: T9SS type A sorting domain-containing protein [bacterium]|nr:T9SS type A sorting domain-containing protein [bacterium]